MYFSCLTADILDEMVTFRNKPGAVGIASPTEPELFNVYYRLINKLKSSGYFMYQQI